MASASDAGTPSEDAIEPTSDGLTNSAVGWAPDEPAAVDAWPAGDVETYWVVPEPVASLDDVSPASSEGWPPETLSVEPASSSPFGLTPLAAASWSTLTP